MALESIESLALESIESLALESLESPALESVGLGSLAPVRELVLLELVLEGSVQISAQLDIAEALGLCIGVTLLVLEEAAQAPAQLGSAATPQL